MGSNAFNFANAAPNLTGNATTASFTTNVTVFPNTLTAGNVTVTNAVIFSDGTSLASGVSAVSVYDYTGDGTTVAYSTGNYSATTVNMTQVYIGGVYQRKNQYSWSGTTLTFTQAPPNGANIEIVVNTFNAPIATPTAGSVQPSSLSTGGPSWDATGNLTVSGNVFARSFRVNQTSPIAGNGLFLYATNTLSIATNSTTQVYIDPNGLVGIGTVAPVVSLDLSKRTDALALPIGTTAQRPGAQTNGMIRFNTTLGYPEWYDASATTWKSFTQTANYTVDYLIVAGGGSGGASGANTSCGGGGAGGYVTGSTTLIGGTPYTVTIGNGGTAATGNNTGNNGGNSSITGLTVAVGGGGGGGGAVATPVVNGANGGSGGGPLNSGTPGTGTAGQGNNGGTTVNAGPAYGGGGGGGAGAVGGTGNGSVGGPGGAGLNWQSLGTFYAGGGGGAVDGTTANGAGGQGGGGAGGIRTPSTAAGSGTANTGGGGGGGNFGGTSGAGGSGVVIIRYTGTQRGSGGTVTSAGGYTYHTFTASGTYSA